MSKSEKQKMPFEKMALEYKEEVLRLGRHVKVSDQLYFSNGEGMGWWLSNQTMRLDKELEKNQILSSDIQKQAEILRDIYSLVTIPKKLTFEDKAIEYHTRIYDMGRPITEEDHICFSDQSDMGNWFENQVLDYYKNSKRYPYKYRNRFPILVSLYESIESLSHERYDNYVSKSKIGR